MLVLLFLLPGEWKTFFCCCSKLNFRLSGEQILGIFSATTLKPRRPLEDNSSWLTQTNDERFHPIQPIVSQSNQYFSHINYKWISFLASAVRSLLDIFKHRRMKNQSIEIYDVYFRKWSKKREIIYKISTNRCWNIDILRENKLISTRDCQMDGQFTWIT